MDIEKDIFSEERVIFRKNQMEKGKKKTKQKREEQPGGVSLKEMKKENEKGDRKQEEQHRKEKGG